MEPKCIKEKPIFDTVINKVNGINREIKTYSQVIYRLLLVY